MGWNEAMSRMLPTVNGNNPHITSGYGAYRSVGTSPHVGTDFNYVGGQTGINLSYPEIHAPVSGTITAVGGRYGIIRIQDSDGFLHDILHTQTQNVRVGDYVESGSAILGTMGGRGALDIRHVHYQIIKDGSTVNPEEYWNTRDSVRPPNRPLEFDLRLTPADEFTLRGYLPDQCFTAGTLILMADGRRKSIENIAIDDVVMAFDGSIQGHKTALSAQRVVRIFTNITQHVVHFNARPELNCTAGHVFLCNNTSTSEDSRFATIASILRNDYAIVAEDGCLIRARTGAEIQSIDDSIVAINYQNHALPNVFNPIFNILVRAGIPVPATTLSDGTSSTQAITLAQHLMSHSISILPDGRLRTIDGMHHAACNWPEGSTPFDTPESCNWIVEVGGKPYTPPWINSLVDTDNFDNIQVVEEDQTLALSTGSMRHHAKSALGV